MSFILGPTCVASNGNTLYAFATSGTGATATITLAQSNTAPSSLANLSWKTIATASQNDLNTVQGYAFVGQVDCVVDDNGVFTVISQATHPVGNPNPLLTVPSGLQYNPATKTWTNINTSPNYKWNIGTGSALFEVTSGGTSTLMQIYGTSTVDQTSTVAVYDPTTHTLVERNGTWPTSGGSSPSAYAEYNNNMYALSYNFLTNATTLSIGAITPDGAPPVSPKTVNVNIGGTCIVYGSLNIKTIVRENLYYLFCGDTKQTTFSWFTYDGTTFSAPTTARVAVANTAGFLPLGPAGSLATWAFLYDVQGIYGVTLTGAQAGTWQTVPYKFNVTGASGSGSGSGSGGGGISGGGGGVGGDNSGSGGLGGLSTGTLAGIIAGAVVVLFVIGCTIWRKKKNSAKPALVAQEPPQLQSLYLAHQLNQEADPENKLTPTPAMVQGPFGAPQQQHYPTKYYQSPYSEAPASVTQTSFQSPHTDMSVSTQTNLQAPYTIYTPPTIISAPHTLPMSSPGNPSTIWSPQSFTNTLTDSDMDSSTIAASSPYYTGSISYGNPQLYAQEQSHAVNLDPRAPQLYPTATAPQDYGQLTPHPSSPGRIRAPQERNEYAQ
ncbi:hypothetical protein BGZ59_008508 [Podila verticillata]|nr:hypothetical protein BGZ59_008508 [Podila verticillata]KFH69671.1 hypothetical protein MVEG_04477 [Podila verticillata NRRL 6337]